MPLRHEGPDTRTASAIYRHSCKLNHACTPTVSQHFRGPRLVLRALVPLQPGDVLRHCYGPQVSLPTPSTPLPKALCAAQTQAFLFRLREQARNVMWHLISLTRRRCSC